MKKDKLIKTIKVLRIIFTIYSCILALIIVIWILAVLFIQNQIWIEDCSSIIDIAFVFGMGQYFIISRLIDHVYCMDNE